MAISAGPKVTTEGLIYSIDPRNSRSFNIGSTAISISNSVTGLTGNSNLRVGASIGRRFGGSISLDGVNDYVTLPLKANWDIGNSYGYDTITFELWIYPEDTDGTCFLSRYYNSGTGNKSITLNGNTVAVIGKTFYSNSITTNWTFTINQWHHIVMTISPTQVVVYKNGTQSFSANHGITMGYDGTTDTMNNEGVVIGTAVPYNYGLYESTTSSLQGSIGLVNVYNKILTADEVSENYKTMKARFNG